MADSLTGGFSLTLLDSRDREVTLTIGWSIDTLISDEFVLEPASGKGNQHGDACNRCSAEPEAREESLLT